jgi:DNA-binding GntR family transcriptional regulator
MANTDAFANLQISRSTTAEHVAAALRTRIVSGEFRPGMPLREVPIAESIGVSRNTVREAFRMLSAEGLVRHSMHRGITVSKLSREDVADIYEARRALELAAIPYVTGEGLRVVEVELQALTDALKRDDHMKIAEADFAFHRAIVAAIGSARLAEFHASLLTEIRLALAIADYRSDQHRVFAADHAAIVDALRKSNFGVAAQCLKSHLDASERIALVTVDEQDALDKGGARASA